MRSGFRWKQSESGFNRTNPIIKRNLLKNIGKQIYSLLNPLSVVIGVADRSSVSIVEVRPLDPGKSFLIVGFPDVGLVGSIVTSHIVAELKMQEAGYIDSELLPPVISVHGGEVKALIRIFDDKDFVAVLSDIPLTQALGASLNRSLVQWAKQKGFKTVLGATGMPIPNRMEVDKPAVLGLATSEASKEHLQLGGIQALQEGMLAGIYALLIKECVKQDMPSLTLLAESYAEFPDPGASASIVEALNKMLNKKIDVQSLIEKADEIRIQSRELMARTQQQMKGMPVELSGIYK